MRFKNFRRTASYNAGSCQDDDTSVTNADMGTCEMGKSLFPSSGDDEYVSVNDYAEK